MQYISLAGRLCSLFVPDCKIPAGGFPLVLSNDGDMPAANFDVLFSQKSPIGFVFLAVPPLDRNREYTPWKAPTLSQKAPCFTGEGGEYLHFLTEKLLPEARQALPFTQEAAHTTLMGYSLGGLHALWSGTQCGAFGQIGCLSGSLWYDGTVDFFLSNTLHPVVHRVYLSLGIAEEKARNPRMARVGNCTREIYRFLQSQVPCTLEWNPGGHFCDIPGRFQKALDWLCR